MHKTEGSNNVLNRFSNGPPGTRVEEDWLNAIQDEIVTVVEAGGLILKTAATETGDQLLAAIQALHLGSGAILSRNALINGDFRVSQRGVNETAEYTAATTPANDNDTYLHDRWLLLSDGNDIVDVTQSTDSPTGGMYSCGLDVETVNKKFGILQIIENKNCKYMDNGYVSLSFDAKVSDNSKLQNIKAMVISWDGAADAVTSDIISAWNAEDTPPTLVANWTAENVPANLNITQTWARYEIESIAIDTAGTNNIGVFIWSDGLCDTAGKFLNVTNIQLEKNVSASEYDWRTFGEELALCQRYYCKSYELNVIPGTATPARIGSTYGWSNGHTNADYSMAMTVEFPVSMRSSPSLTIYDMAGTSGKVTTETGDGRNAVVSTAAGNRGFVFSGTNGAATTTRKLIGQYTAVSEL